MTAENFQPAGFPDFGVGDRIRFVTANNGFGADGNDVLRTGTVTKVTDKTITVACDPSAYGSSVARIRRADWDARCPTRAAATRVPRNADNVKIVDEGGVVTALYIPDPEQAKDPAYVLENILDRRYEEVEVIAEASRFTKRMGATFSGWVVRSGLEHTDPIANKRAAMQSLHDHIQDYFDR